MLKAVRESGGWGESVTDAEIVDGIKLLARTEGIFTEPAGGTTLAVDEKLIEQGRIPRDESIVICVTGNGYKTLEAVVDGVEQPYRIPARLADFDALYTRLARQPRSLDRLTSERIRGPRRIVFMTQVRVPTPLRKLHRRLGSRRGRGRDRRRRCSPISTRDIPGIRDRICDESGQVRRFVNVFVNGEDIRFLQQLETPVKAGDEVSIVPAIAGGR